VPYCAYCRWRYEGTPRYCRDCGHRIYRSTGGHHQGAHWVSPRLVTSVVGVAAMLAGLAVMVHGTLTSAQSLTGLPLDEAWTRLVYARSVALEGRLAFNPGPAEASVSSLLWVLLLAALIKTLGALGISVVALAKGASLIAAVIAAILSARLAHRLTASGMFALGVGLVVAIDPEFAFAAASGIETTLLAALLVGATLALSHRRYPVAGGLLLLAALTRPEALIFAGVLGAGAILAGAARWRGGGPPVPLVPNRAMLSVAALGLSVVGFLIWGLLDGMATGGFVPRATGRALTLWVEAPGFSPTSLLRGYFNAVTWWALGAAIVVGLPLFLIGAVSIIRLGDWRIVPIAAFPVLLWLGGAVLYADGAGPWTFEHRRVLDAGIPFASIAIVMGARTVGSWLLGAGGRIVSAPFGASLTRVLVMICAATLVWGMGDLWPRQIADYAAATRRLNDTYFAAALAARATLPEDALIAATEPGTLRYVSRRPVDDLRGLHTRDLAEMTPVAALATARAQYAVLPVQRAFLSIPSLALRSEFAPPPWIGGTSVGFFEIAPRPLSPRDSPHAFSLDALQRLDYLDVGDPTSESAHDYSAPDSQILPRSVSRVTERAAVDDDARAFTATETFTLRAMRARDLILARRSGDSDALLMIAIDGQRLDEWRPRRGMYAVSEDSLTVPGYLIRGDVVRIQISLAQVGGVSPSYAYWTFARRG